MAHCGVTTVSTVAVPATTANTSAKYSSKERAAAGSHRPGCSRVSGCSRRRCFRSRDRSHAQVHLAADPAARWTGAHGGQAFFAYSTNYLIDVDNAIIVDVEATTAIRQAEVLAAKRMIERSMERFDLYPARTHRRQRLWLRRDARLVGA